MNYAEKPISPFSGEGDGTSPRLAVKLNLLAAPPGIPAEAVVEQWISHWITEKLPGAESTNRAMMQAGNTLFDVRTVRLPAGITRHVFFQVGTFPEMLPPDPATGDRLSDRGRAGAWQAWLLVAGFVIIVVSLLAWGTRARDVSDGSPWLLPVLAGAGSLLGWLTLHPWLARTKVAGVRLSGLSAFAIGLGLLTWMVIWHGFPVCRVFLENACGTNVELRLNGGAWVRLPSGSSTLAIWPREPGEVTVRNADTGTELARYPVGPCNSGPYVLNVLGAQTYYLGTLTYTLNRWPPQPPTDPWETPVTESWFEARVDYLFEEPPSAIEVKTDSSYADRTLERTYLLRHSIHEPSPYQRATDEFIRRIQDGSANSAGLQTTSEVRSK